MEVCLLSRKKVEFSKSAATGMEVLCLRGKAEVDFPLPGVGFPLLEKSLARRGALQSKMARLDTDLQLSFKVLVSLRTPSVTHSFYVIGNKCTEDNCLSRLERACGGMDNFRLIVELKLVADGGNKIGITEQELRVVQVRSHFEVTRNFNITEDYVRTWNANSKFTGELSVRVKLDDRALQGLQMDNLEDPFSTCRAVRKDTASTDAVIVCDGGQVKCHKGFLSAHSTVFKAMFKSSMKEGKSGVVELPDMTASGVRALLDYLYFWDIKRICTNCSMAMELLGAADKYNIPRLQNVIQELLLGKETDWFTVPMAIKLVQFANIRAEAGGSVEENGVYKAIEAKSMAVLKSKSTAELHGCPEFRQLFQNPQIGMAFCTYTMHFDQ